MGCTHSASSPVIAIGSPSSSSSSSSLPSTPYVAARRAIENGNLGKLRKILNRPELLTSATPLTAEDLETLCTVAARTDRIQCLMLLADYADRANIHLTFVAAYLAANIHDQRSEVGYRELLGANRTRLQPGLRWNLPILHELHRVDMRETGMPVSRLNCYTEDNVPVSVSGTLFMRVVDPEKACFEVVDYRSAMFDVGQSTVRAVVGRFQFDEIIRDRNAVNQQLRAILGSSTDKWGVVCTRFELEDFGPQNRGVSETMERQMNAERHRREKELNTQADIRTAEGDKLARNHASDAAFYQAQKTADAAKYAADQATAAQTTRVAQIRAALPALSDQQVAAMVLEERRLAHLAAIAEHPDGKNTYFIDPNGSFPAVQTLLSAARTAE